MSTTIITRNSTLAAALAATLERERAAAHAEIDNDFNALKEQLFNNGNGKPEVTVDSGDSQLDSPPEFPPPAPRRNNREGPTAGVSMQLTPAQFNTVQLAIKYADGRLTIREAALLRARFVDRLPNNDVAKRLKMHPSTVSKSVRTALEKLGVSPPPAGPAVTGRWSQKKAKMATRRRAKKSFREEVLG
jgi:DNA-binding NarL/FixJ family response regulator